MFGINSNTFTVGTNYDEPMALRQETDDIFRVGPRDYSEDEELPIRESSVHAPPANAEPPRQEDEGGENLEQELLIPKGYHPHGREYSFKIKCIWFLSGAVFGVVFFAILVWPFVLSARKIWGCTNSSWLEDLFEAIVPSGYLSFLWTFKITGITLLVYIVIYVLIALQHVPDVLRIRSFIIDILTKLPCMLAFLPFASMFSILTMNKTSYLLREERRRQARAGTPSGFFQLALRFRVFLPALGARRRPGGPQRVQQAEGRASLQIQAEGDRELGSFGSQEYAGESSPVGFQENDENDDSIASISNSNNSSRNLAALRQTGEGGGVPEGRRSKTVEAELYPSGLFLLLCFLTLVVPLVVLVVLAVIHMVHSDHLDIESFVSPLCVLIGCILSVGICTTGICLRKSHLPYYFPVTFFPDFATIFGRGLWLAFGIIVWVIVITGGLFPGSTISCPLPDASALNKTSIKVMTWNMGCSDLNAVKKVDLWENRKKDFVDALEYFKADVFVLQDAYFLPLRYVRSNTHDKDNGPYQWYGKASRDGVHTGEHAAIFFRKSRFQLLQSNTFWLSNTPPIPSSFSRNPAHLVENGSPRSGANIEDDDTPHRDTIARNIYLNQRVCSWVRLREVKSGQQLIVATAHYGAGGEAYNMKATRLILSQLRKASHSGNLPVVFLGDFNGNSSQSWFKELTNSSAGADIGFSDSMAVCKGILCLPRNCTEPLEWTRELKCNATLG